MTAQYDVIQFLQSYETHTVLRNGMKCIPVLILKSLKHTDFLKQIIFLKSINSLFKVDFKATGKRTTLSSSENRMVSTIYTFFFKPNNLNVHKS